MSDKHSFLRQFWKEKKMVGAMAPSSRFLAHKMLENVDFNKSKILIELGPGTGVFTKRILAEMASDAVFLVFELNPDFYQDLSASIKDPRVRIINDTAEKAEYYLKKYNLGMADVIISSLPLANFPTRLRHSILKASAGALSPDGKFIQFQYSLQSKKHLSKFFPTISIDFTPLNLPPAFIYTCMKK